MSTTATISPEWSAEEDRLVAEIAKKVQAKEMKWREADIPNRTWVAAKTRFKRLKKGIAREERVDIPLGKPLPTAHDFFGYLRDHQRTLEQIANKFSISPAQARSTLSEMDKHGYLVAESKAEEFAISTASRPTVETPKISIADLAGQEFAIAFASDLHSGSRHSQPTSYNKFIHYVYEVHGVRHVFDPGDKFAGLYGYRGQAEDLVPTARPLSRDTAWQAAEAQIELANLYTPVLPDLKYYLLGGNHDWWITTTTGIDAVRRLCDKRPDFVYGGYDVWSIPLTDQTHLRLWHPRGGQTYARSYKIQKAMEQQAFEALREAMRNEMEPIVSILAAGHLHITIFVPDPPLFGLHAGCFEGKTNLLKQLGLTPHIGGVLMKFRIRDNGRIGEVSYTFVPFEEIDDDWKEWPEPQVETFREYEASTLGTLFSASQAPDGG